MSNSPVVFDCDVCGSNYKHGPHVYEGHMLNLYGGLFACDVCWKGNHDGWAPQFEAVLLKRLEEKGLPVPERNPKGLLPRE